MNTTSNSSPLAECTVIICSVLAFARLVLARFQRGVSKKRGERVDRFARFAEALLLGERRRRVHELLQVLDAVGALALGPVVLDEAALRNHRLDYLFQG